MIACRCNEMRSGVARILTPDARANQFSNLLPFWVRKVYPYYVLARMGCQDAHGSGSPLPEKAWERLGPFEAVGSVPRLDCESKNWTTFRHLLEARIEAGCGADGSFVG